MRRLLARFDRRWIRDRTEREKHDVRVRRRLAGDPAEDEPVAEPPG
ncbi:MAG TPA: hypothetical protein VI277_01160 [Candidatus Limnocylindria bacterium]